MKDEPDFAPEPGWRVLDMPRNFGAGRSFVSGEPEGDRLRIHYYLREEDNVLFAKAWFGLGAEGPPGHAHGGSMAAVLDEVMGFACWVAGHPVVAATITINFKKQLPLHQVYWVESHLERVDGRKVHTTSRLFDPATQKVFADGAGLFIAQPMERFGNLQHAPRQRKA
ncbi:MAG: PaaI family thioesterase [Candidatus Hydrogenedentes bacterium]|nr:PaaI family thioesterase [Candidatus Hydrogenedentota bacterium]